MDEKYLLSESVISKSVVADESQKTQSESRQRGARDGAWTPARTTWVARGPVLKIKLEMIDVFTLTIINTKIIEIEQTFYFRSVYQTSSPWH